MKNSVEKYCMMWTKLITTNRLGFTVAVLLVTIVKSSWIATSARE